MHCRSDAVKQGFVFHPCHEIVALNFRCAQDIRTVRAIVIQKCKNIIVRCFILRRRNAAQRLGAWVRQFAADDVIAADRCCRRRSGSRCGCRCRLIIKSVQERHYLGAVAYLRRRKGRFGLAVCYVVGDGPNDRAAAERIISNIAEAADIADIGASLRTIEERYHLSARTRLLGREFCAARSLGYAVFDGPANGIITIIAIMHIVKRHPCIDRRLAGCAPEEGHYLAACACLLRAKVALIKAVCDALFDRPIDGLGVILIRSNVNKAGLLRLCYRRIADRARRISHCSGRACGYRSARFTEISASVIVILLAGVRYIHSIIRRSSDSQQRAQQRENKKQCN